MYPTSGCFSEELMNDAVETCSQKQLYSIQQLYYYALFVVGNFGNFFSLVTVSFDVEYILFWGIIN